MTFLGCVLICAIVIENNFARCSLEACKVRSFGISLQNILVFHITVCEERGVSCLESVESHLLLLVCQLIKFSHCNRIFS